MGDTTRSISSQLKKVKIPGDSTVTNKMSVVNEGTKSSKGNNSKDLEGFSEYISTDAPAPIFGAKKSTNLLLLQR
jgi:hypothetical protein